MKPQGFLTNQRSAVSPWIAAVAVVLVAVLVAGIAMSAISQQGKQPTYIASVGYSKTKEIVSYNYANILKDSIVLGGVSFALGACTTGTIGACVAALPGVGAVLNPTLGDTVETATSYVTLTNVGNGTATNLSFTGTTYSDQSVISSVSYIVGDLPPNQQVTVELVHMTTVADVPAALWNSLQGKGAISFQVSNLEYGSARP